MGVGGLADLDQRLKAKGDICSARCASRRPHTEPGTQEVLKPIAHALNQSTHGPQLRARLHGGWGLVSPGGSVKPQAISGAP